MLITIDGRFTSDMELWITFGTSAVDTAIHSVPNVSGLVLAGTLTENDCQAICAKKQSLQLLDLSRASLPAGISKEHFTVGAPLLRTLRWPEHA